MGLVSLWKRLWRDTLPLSTMWGQSGLLELSELWDMNLCCYPDWYFVIETWMDQDRDISLLCFRHGHFWAADSFCSKSGIYEALKKKTQATNHHVLFKVSRSLAGPLSSFHLSESSYVCFVYNVRSFGVYLAGGIGKSISTLFFSKCKFSFSVFDVTVWLMSC